MGLGMLTREGLMIFVAGATTGILLTVIGAIIALQCLVWRGLL